MSASIWDQTLAAFRDRLATRESVPAGVSVAAVSATFALGLLTKTLTIASRRKDFAGDRELAESLIEDARRLSDSLARHADEDIVAFREHSRAAIDVPLEIARAAASGVKLCERASPLVHAAVAPDLATALALLRAAHRSAHDTAESNTQK